MGFSRRNKIWLTGSLVNTSLKLMMWMKKHKRQMKPSASVARCGSTFNLIQLETALHWQSLCRPLLRPFQKNTPQKLNTASQTFHPCLTWASKTKVRSHSSAKAGRKDPTMRHELPGLATLPEQPWTPWWCVLLVKQGWCTGLVSASVAKRAMTNDHNDTGHL